MPAGFAGFFFHGFGHVRHDESARVVGVINGMPQTKDHPAGIKFLVDIVFDGLGGVDLKQHFHHPGIGPAMQITG